MMEIYCHEILWKSCILTIQNYTRRQPVLHMTRKHPTPTVNKRNKKRNLIEEPLHNLPLWNGLSRYVNDFAGDCS